MDDIIRVRDPMQDNVLRGLATETSIAATMKAWLDEIVADDRSHIQVGEDLRLSLYDVLPRGWVDAVVCFAAGQGYASELLHQWLMSRLSFF